MNKMLEEIKILCQATDHKIPDSVQYYTMRSVYKVWGKELLHDIGCMLREERNNTLEEIAVHCDLRAMVYEAGRFENHRLEAEHLAAKIRSMKT